MKLRTLILVIVVILTAASCQKERHDIEGRLDIYLELPEMASSKSGIGETIPELKEEAKINDLRIWVFLSEDVDANHKDGDLLGFLQPVKSNSQKDPLTAFENKYYIKLDAVITERHPSVDIYVVGNAPAFGQNNLNSQTKRDVLDAAILGGNYYGIVDGKPYVSAGAIIPSGNNGGLPFSGVGKNLQMKGSYPVLSVDVVKVKRAVSKFRFVFSQLVDEVGPVMDFEITDLRLDGNQICESEMLFNDNTSVGYKLSSPATYIGSPLVFDNPASSQIAYNTAPQEYAYQTGMSAQEYENKVFQGILKHDLTDWGRCYLRESDKPLSGSISYTIGGIPGTTTFQMSGTEVFSRNTSWIVYIFFLRDEMKFTVSWTDWLDGGFFNLTQ